MYILTLTPLQSNFYHALFAPFRDDELSQVPARGSKKTLTYIDKRALENRLDTVCGPHGWYPEYEATARGYKCRLSILVPTQFAKAGEPAEPGKGWAWLPKEDGAGFEEMGRENKATGEFEYDVDNDEKSGYTNALRRAAQDAWGIGRYLYNKGLPLWLNPANVPLSAAPPRMSEAEISEASIDALASHDREPGTQDLKSGTPASSSVPVVASPTPALTVPSNAKLAVAPAPVNPIQLPRNGRSAFPWAKDMERIFDCRVVQGMVANAKDLGWSDTIADWTEDQTRHITLGAAAHLMSQPKYAGQFSHLATEIATHIDRPKPAKPQTPGVNVADLRKGLYTKLCALITKQSGRPATVAEAKVMFEDVAPQCVSSSGHVGEVPESLNKTADVVWLNNMHRFMDDQIAHAAGPLATPEAADTPF